MADGSTLMGKPRTESAPPLSIPLLFMGAGLVGTIFGLGLVAHAGILIVRGQFTSPPVLVAVHTLTLGSLTSSMMGALYQWGPVITGGRLASVPVAVAHFVCWILGLISFLWGLATLSPLLLAIGGGFIVIAVGLFLTGMALSLPPGANRLAPVRLVTSALWYLGLTVLFGSALDVHLWTSWAIIPMARVLAAHIVIAVAGWLGLTLIGVSYRLFPMFVVSPSKPGHSMGVLGTMHLAILSAVVGFLAGWPWLEGTAVGIGVLSVILYLADMGQYWRHHRSRASDPAVATVKIGLVTLALVLLMGVLALLTRSPGVLRTVPELVLGVFLSSILGFGQRIWPFMAWLQASRQVNARTVPHLAELWPLALSRSITLAVPVSLGLGTAGLLWQQSLVFQAGTVLLGLVFLATAIVVWRMLHIARHRRYPVGSRIFR